MGVVRTALSDRLGLRLVVATLLISTLFSAVASGVQLYLSYQRQVGSALEIVGRDSLQQQGAGLGHAAAAGIVNENG